MNENLNLTTDEQRRRFGQRKIANALRVEADAIGAISSMLALEELPLPSVYVRVRAARERLQAIEKDIAEQAARK